MSMTAIDDRDTLETALLQAQIDQIELDNKNRLLRDFLPSVAALLVVIGGMIAGSIMISNYWESEVSAARQDLNALALVRSEVENSIADLNAKAETGPGGASSGNTDANLAISFHECDELVCSFSVESTMRDVEFDVFSDCSGTFVIPDSYPDFTKGNCVGHNQKRICSANDARTICRFGPFALSQHNSGWWLRTVSDANVIVRYINFVSN